jgi:hypothetical protein
MAMATAGTLAPLAIGAAAGGALSGGAVGATVP